MLIAAANISNLGIELCSVYPHDSSCPSDHLKMAAACHREAASEVVIIVSARDVLIGWSSCAPRLERTKSRKSAGERERESEGEKTGPAY